MRGPVFITLAQLANAPEVEPDWIWPGYVTPGSLTLLAGRPKVGKSTLLFELMAAIDGGATFCGRATRRARIVLLSEEREGTLREKARSRQWSDAVSLLLHHTAYAITWPEIVRYAAEHVGPGGLVIVDTLADFAGLAADAENTAGAVLSTLRPLQEVAGNDRAVLVVSHQRKAAGDHGEAVRGSNALTGAVDVVIEFERAPGIGDYGRVLKAGSRFSATPADLVVRQTERGYEAFGELASATAASELERVAARIAELGEVTAEEIAEDLGLSKGTVQRRLVALRSAGRLARTGAGNRGDPYRWRPVFDSASGDPNGRIESGARDAAPVAEFDSTHGPNVSRSESIREADASSTRRDDPMLAALANVAETEPRWLPQAGT